MRARIRHADLVARALGQLEDSERERIDRALATDARLRQRFEAISSHLVLYDDLPPAPPAPPFERIEERLGPQGTLAPADRVGAGDAVRTPPFAWPRRAALAATGLAATGLAAIGLLLWMAGSGERSVGDRPTVAARLGPGVAVVRDARVVRPPRAEPEAMDVQLAPGDVLRADRTAEAWLADRVRVVLDGGAPVRIDAPDRVLLQAGRAFFEVEPGAFTVDTPHGAVRVLGTAFEVDVRAGLVVNVAEGRVAAEGSILDAGQQLAGGTITPSPEPPGAWFRLPRIALARSTTAAATAGEPVELELVVENPGYVPLRAADPNGLRTSVWMRVQGPGEETRDFPVLARNVVSGGNLLQPGQPVILGARERRTLTVRFHEPFQRPGTYRVSAFYRPEGQPDVLSTPIEIEVR